MSYISNCLPLSPHFMNRKCQQKSPSGHCSDHSLKYMFSFYHRSLGWVEPMKEKPSKWHWLLPPRNQAIDRNTQNFQTSIVPTDRLLLQWVSSATQPVKSFPTQFDSTFSRTEICRMTNFLVSYSFTAVRLWLMAMGIFWHVGSKVLQENWRRQKWERQWLKMHSSPASPQGRTELSNSYGSKPWHSWWVSDPARKPSVPLLMAWGDESSLPPKV